MHSSSLHNNSLFSFSKKILLISLMLIGIIILNTFFVSNVSSSGPEGLQAVASSEQNQSPLLQADQPQIYPIFAPDTPPAVIEEFYKRFPDHAGNRGTGENEFTFDDNGRWTTTATNGGGLTQGDPTTLTWSILKDGTIIPGFNGEPTAASNLIAFLDGIYGAGPGGSDLTQRPWFPLFIQIFDNWGKLTGITYVYEANDDGASFGNASGVLGVRGDMRIGGHRIDGNSRVLAYNFFPNVGEMVIDTDDNFYANNTGMNSLGLRNVLAHEHGHGLGIFHVCPVNETKLMEPFVSFAFDGPQPDDILVANRGYGDSFEPNDSSAAARDLGALGNGTRPVTDTMSVDDNSDIDFIKFTITSKKVMTATLAPEGSTYLSGPQVSGACTPGSSFNAKSQSDLSVQVLGPDGSTVLGTANSTGAGSNEVLAAIALETPGTYYLKVSGADNATQLYTMALELQTLGLTINKSAVTTIPDPGDPITFTLSYENADPLMMQNVTITDVIPSGVLSPTFTSSGPKITATGTISYVWQVGNLATGQSGIITMTGVVSPSLKKGVDSFTNHASISGFDGTTTKTSSSSVNIYVGGVFAYLPIVMKN